MQSLTNMDQEIQTLTKQLHEIADEIRSFTGQIPACDVHYNSLLEERKKLSRKISDLKQHQAPANSSREQNKK